MSEDEDGFIEDLQTRIKIQIFDAIDSRCRIYVRNTTTKRETPLEQLPGRTINKNLAYLITKETRICSCAKNDHRQVWK